MNIFKEFIVAGRHANGFYSGRNCDYDIHVGDEFTVIFNYPKVTTEMWAELVKNPDLWYSLCYRQNVRAIRLKIEECHAYGKSLEGLGSGMTGAIKLSGRGLEEIVISDNCLGCILAEK